jgi:hypothetical protein
MEMMGSSIEMLLLDFWNEPINQCLITSDYPWKEFSFRPRLKVLAHVDPILFFSLSRRGMNLASV